MTVASRLRRLSAATALAALAVGGLAGCAGEVPLEAAPNANDPRCADVVVRLPDIVADQEKRNTNAQATGAWGDPASVLLYCGIEPSGPTTLPCVTVNGVDWIRDDSNAPLYRFEAYGRSPGLHVIIDAEGGDGEAGVSGTSALVDLGSAVSVLPQERKCSSTIDDLELPGEAGDDAVLLP